MERNQPPAGSAERRGGRTSPGAPAPRSRKPALLGTFVAAGAIGAWLLRRERSQPPEGTWRDLLSSDEPQTRRGSH
ncbi:MAG TPA: hypothetical protein VII47_09205 [Actinomycetota bacterium]